MIIPHIIFHTFIIEAPMHDLFKYSFILAIEYSNTEFVLALKAMIQVLLSIHNVTYTHKHKITNETKVD